jgi:hypothetical protein
MIMRGIKITLSQLAPDFYEKEFWGLGIPGLKDLNMCLLGSWVKRFIIGEEYPL